LKKKGEIRNICKTREGYAMNFWKKNGEYAVFEKQGWNKQIFFEKRGKYTIFEKKNEQINFNEKKFWIKIQKKKKSRQKYFGGLF